MKHLLAVMAVVATALVVAAPANAHKAEPPDTFQVGDAAILGPVKVRGDVAYVHARYSCDIGTHIWVSVKQGSSRQIDPAVSAEGAGGSGAATAWWQSHRGTFTCDGKRHAAWFAVDTVEPGSRGQLARGWGYVQFCITTDTDLIAVRQQWSKVKVKGHDHRSDSDDDDDGDNGDRDDD
jgi:hypothetical protein